MLLKFHQTFGGKSFGALKRRTRRECNENSGIWEDLSLFISLSFFVSPPVIDSKSTQTRFKILRTISYDAITSLFIFTTFLEICIQ